MVDVSLEKNTRLRGYKLTSCHIAVLVASAIMVAGCSTPPSDGNERVALGTSMPVFAMIIKEVVGDSFDVETLIDNAQSPHAFHPKPSDVQKMVGIRMMVLGSQELDGWASDLVDAPVLYLSEFVPEDLWIVDGNTRNPHFWMDPILIKDILEPLADQLCSLAPAGCTQITARRENFSERLDSLHVSIQELLADASERHVYVAQPFMDYFLHRYDLKIAGTLETVPGNEPPPSHIVEMLNTERTEDEIGILAHERLPHVTAGVFAEESDLPVAFLDPIGRLEDTSYFDFMIRNTRAINTLLESSK